MDMAVQPLRQFERQPVPRFAPILARRAFILAGTAILTVAGCYEMYEVLQVGGITVLESIILALFVLLFAWIALSFMSAFAGFALLLTRRKNELGIDPGAALPAIESRTAMLLPTYNEDPYRVLARLRAIYELVGKPGMARGSTGLSSATPPTPPSGSPKKNAFCNFARTLAAQPRIFYRHRSENTARKSGNIEDWVRRFGSEL